MKRINIKNTKQSSSNTELERIARLVTGRFTNQRKARQFARLWAKIFNIKPPKEQ